MATISEELEAAKAAKAAINVLLTKATPISVVSKMLRDAKHAAVLNLGSGGGLTEVRANVGIALSSLLDRPPTPERIDKAKSAVDAWIKELEVGKP